MCSDRDGLGKNFKFARAGQEAAGQQDVVGFYLRPCFDKIIAVSGNAVYQNHTPAVRQQGGGVGNRALSMINVNSG